MRNYTALSRLWGRGGGLWAPHIIPGSSGPLHSGLPAPPKTCRSVQPFLQGSLQASSDSSPVSERPRTTVICRSTASRSPVLTRGGICVPPSQPSSTCRTEFPAVGRSQLLARWPGTHCRISSGIQRAVQTVFWRLLKTYLFARY